MTDGSHHRDACCAPASDRAGHTEPGLVGRFSGHQESRAMIHLDGGSFLMGHDQDEGYPEDGEGPMHQVELSPFRIDATSITNELFAEFVGTVLSEVAGCPISRDPTKVDLPGAPGRT